MSELKEELRQISAAVHQAWELTYHIEQVANKIYEEDMCNDWAISLIGVKELIDREVTFALKKIKELDKKEVK